MPILLIAEQPKLDAQTYAFMIEPLTPLLRSAKGFMFHAGGPSPAGGMRIVEGWESEADSRAFFEKYLKPNLPANAVPDFQYHELNAAFAK